MLDLSADLLVVPSRSLLVDKASDAQLQVPCPCATMATPQWFMGLTFGFLFGFAACCCMVECHVQLGALCGIGACHTPSARFFAVAPARLGPSEISVLGRRAPFLGVQLLRLLHHPDTTKTFTEPCFQPGAHGRHPVTFVRAGCAPASGLCCTSSFLTWRVLCPPQRDITTKSRREQ